MYLQLCFAKENSHHNPLIVTTHLKILRTFKKFNKFSELSFQTVESFQMMHINLNILTVYFHYHCCHADQNFRCAC